MCAFGHNCRAALIHKHALLVEHSYIDTLHIEEVQLNVAITYLYFRFTLNNKEDGEHFSKCACLSLLLTKISTVSVSERKTIISFSIPRDSGL